ncbi:hypothetical protein GGR54DRAFT_457413 [Hypoxylon sp. NC1633]|nr:hypothetical protein GGR54DRAFT_457413 [Hypoxylon sp. NC1633]
MATVTRQPFAPLDGTRLQTLTSLKNRQNALSVTSPVKRKAADSLDTDDFENVDPLQFSKRSKGSDNLFSKDSFVKPGCSFILTKSASTNNLSLASTPKHASPRARALLNPKSPVAKLNAGIAKSTPLSAPAGRSPTRGKRAGILSRRRTGAGFSRVDPPPVFGLSTTSSTPFSLDAALKGTIPSYSDRDTALIVAKPSDSLLDGDMKSSWFFDIHEDTPDQEMTNLLQHSTRVLDISSDEESESRRQRERAEGKENVPPMDDVSQTSRPRAARAAALSDDLMVFEKERNPLGEMDVREYYSEGVDENSVIIIPGDDEDDDQQPQLQPQLSDNVFQPTPQLRAVESDPPSQPTSVQSVDELMQKTDEPAPGAAVLEPMEGTGENFEVWESGSAKDEAETTVTGTTAEC